MADTSMHFFPRWGDRRYLQVEICIWVNFVLLFFENSAIGYCCWCPMVRIKKFFILYFRFTRKKEMDDFVWNYWKQALWTGVLVIMNMDSSCHEFRFFFRVRLLSVLRGHSVFSSPPTSKDFLSQILSITLIFLS